MYDKETDGMKKKLKKSAVLGILLSTAIAGGLTFMRRK